VLPKTTATRSLCHCRAGYVIDYIIFRFLCFDIRNSYSKLCFNECLVNVLTLQVSGIFENYVEHYALVSFDSYQSQLGWTPPCKSAYLNVADDADPHQIAARLMNMEGVSNVLVNADVLERVSNMLKSMDAVILLVLACAVALALVVMFNLSNINITERIREIATIKVLGFTRRETSSYVFRENLVLTVIGMLLGLVGGKFLHRYVISQINVDMIHFDTRLGWDGYLIAAVLTLLLAWVIELLQQRRLNRINMAEYLKSVE